jgi:hypothetical protein
VPFKDQESVLWLLITAAGYAGADNEVGGYCWSTSFHFCKLLSFQFRWLWRSLKGQHPSPYFISFIFFSPLRRHALKTYEKAIAYTKKISSNWTYSGKGIGPQMTKILSFHLSLIFGTDIVCKNRAKYNLPEQTNNKKTQNNYCKQQILGKRENWLPITTIWGSNVQFSMSKTKSQGIKKPIKYSLLKKF